METHSYASSVEQNRMALALLVCEVPDGALLFATASTPVVCYLSIKTLFREILWAGENLLKHTNLFLRKEYVHIVYY